MRLKLIKNVKDEPSLHITSFESDAIRDRDLKEDKIHRVFTDNNTAWSYLESR